MSPEGARDVNDDDEEDRGGHRDRRNHDEYYSESSGSGHRSRDPDHGRLDDDRRRSGGSRDRDRGRGRSASGERSRGSDRGGRGGDYESGYEDESSDRRERDRDRDRDRDSDAKKYAGMTGAQIERLRNAERSWRKARLSDDQYDELESLLQNITVSRKAIVQTMGLALDNVDAAEEVGRFPINCMHCTEASTNFCSKYSLMIEIVC